MICSRRRIGWLDAGHNILRGVPISLSAIMARGARPCSSSSLRISRLAALAFRPLYKHVEHETILVDGASEPLLLVIDGGPAFVHMRLVTNRPADRHFMPPANCRLNFSAQFRMV